MLINEIFEFFKDKDQKPKRPSPVELDYRGPGPGGINVPPYKPDPTRVGFQWWDKMKHNIASGIAAQQMAAEPFTPDPNNPYEVEYAKKYGTGSTFNVPAEELVKRKQDIRHDADSNKFTQEFTSMVGSRIDRDKEDYENTKSTAFPESEEEWKVWIEHEIEEALGKEKVDLKKFKEVFSQYEPLMNSFAKTAASSDISYDPNKRFKDEPKIAKALSDLGTKLYDDLKRNAVFHQNTVSAAQKNIIYNRRDRVASKKVPGFATAQPGNQSQATAPAPTTATSGTAPAATSTTATVEPITLGGEKWTKTQQGWVNSKNKPATANDTIALNNIQAQIQNPSNARTGYGPRNRPESGTNRTTGSQTQAQPPYRSVTPTTPQGLATQPNRSNVTMRYQGNIVPTRQPIQTTAQGQVRQPNQNPVQGPTMTQGQATDQKPRLRPDPNTGKYPNRLSESLLNQVNRLSNKQKARLLAELKKNTGIIK